MVNFMFSGTPCTLDIVHVYKHYQRQEGTFKNLWKSIGNGQSTGSPKKHENWKTTWGTLTEILERMKGHSIKSNMRKMCVLLLEFYCKLFNRGLVYSYGRIFKVKKSACPMVSGTPCISEYMHSMFSGTPCISEYMHPMFSGTPCISEYMHPFLN